MKYPDGNQAKIGDRVMIDGQYHGVVVVDLDGNEYSADFPKHQWSYLLSGIMIDTDFAGLIHYQLEPQAAEQIELVSRD